MKLIETIEIYQKEVFVKREEREDERGKRREIGERSSRLLILVVLSF